MIKNKAQYASRVREQTAQPIATIAANGPNALKDSEFFRLPKPGARCPISGLARTSILEHGEAGNFKIVRLRKPHAKRGVVLVETRSFLSWLHAQPAARRVA
jgi:hypothetical protein